MLQRISLSHTLNQITLPRTALIGSLLLAAAVVLPLAGCAVPVIAVMEESRISAQQEAQAAQQRNEQERILRQSDETHLLAREQEFKTGNLPVSLAVLYGDMADYYVKHSQFAKARETVDTGLALTARLKGEDLSQVNDAGSGRTLDAAMKDQEIGYTWGGPNDEAKAGYRKYLLQMRDSNLRSAEYKLNKAMMDVGRLTGDQALVEEYQLKMYQALGWDHVPTQEEMIAKGKRDAEKAYADAMAKAGPQKSYEERMREAGWSEKQIRQHMAAMEDVRRKQAVAQEQQRQRTIAQDNIWNDAVRRHGRVVLAAAKGEVSDARIDEMVAGFEKRLIDYQTALADNIAENEQLLRMYLLTFQVPLHKDAQAFMEAFAYGESRPREGRSSFPRFLDYYDKYMYQPQVHAAKAFLYWRIGRADRARQWIDLAIDTFANRPPEKVETVHGPWVLTEAPPAGLQMPGAVFQIAPPASRVPVAWRLLQASVATEQGDPQAEVLWRGILNSLKTMVDESGMAASAELAGMQQTYEFNALRTMARLHARLGDNAKARAAIEDVLAVLETARASLSAESARMHYLSQNRAVYDQFLAVSADAPVANLIAMERAKSRAMADLMAQRIEATGDATLVQLAGNRDKAKRIYELAEGDSAQRGLAVVATDLDAQLAGLKDSRPELYALVAVEPLSEADLRAIIPPGSAVLSYYLTEDAININLYQDGQSMVRRVEVPKMTVMAKIFDLRRRIYEGKTSSGLKGDIGLAVDWSIRGDREVVAVTNNLPFPLEVSDVVRVEQSDTPAFTYDFADAFREDVYPTPPAVRTIAVGESRVLMDIPVVFGHKVDAEQAVLIRSTGSRAGRSAYANSVRNAYVTMYLKTNIGDLKLKSYRVVDPDKAEMSVVDTPPLTAKVDPRSLYDLLIAPVAGRISAKHLVVVPHGALHFLPFDALQNAKGRYLVQDFAVSYVPSLTVLKHAKAGNSGRAERLVAFADPLGDLKFARREAQAIKKLFPSAAVIEGQQVTVDAVRRSVGQADIVHFASHAVFDAERPFDSALLLSGGGGRIAPFTVSDVLGLRFKPYLVTMSACETGLARIGGGDELLGLMRGFFVAGSPSLLTTLWKIDDQSTERLMIRFYDNLVNKGMNKAVALADAKRYLIAKGVKEPYYWAPFVLQGDWN